MVFADKIYDKIFIGGGLASLFTAYATLVLAKEAGKDFQILLVADEVKAPVIAGSHCVAFVEGLAEDGVQNRDAIQRLLREDGREGLRHAIAKEQIACRFVPGYEIKARTSAELEKVLHHITDGRRSFTDSEAAENSNDQTIKINGYAHSIAIESTLAQVNTPDLLNGLLSAIKNMGGEMMIPAHYLGHDISEHGVCRVRTDRGVFNTSANPFLGTGALHQSALPHFPVKHDISYTAGLVIGPLTDEDTTKIAAKPMAFCDSNFEDDVLWGGIDPYNMLTIGKGDLASPERLPALEWELKSIADNILPGVTAKYQSRFNSGAIMTAENALPVVGRANNYDLAGGWAGLGIVAGFAAAQAFALWYVTGDDTKLTIFEAMQPGRFPGVAVKPPFLP